MLIQMPILLALYRVFYNIPAYITSVKDYFGVLSDNSVVSGSLVDIINHTSGYQDIMTKIVEDYKIHSVVTDFTITDTTVLNNYIVDVLYKLPKEGWDNLTSYFSNIGDAVSEITPHINNFNYVFGLNISDTPWHTITTSWSSIQNSVDVGASWLLLILAVLIPVLSYVTQLINIKLMPTAAGNDQNDAMARQMKTMNMMMPLMSLFLCFTVPVGLGIYWIFSAVVRGVQQFFVNKHIQNLDLDDVIEKNKEKAKKKREKRGIKEEQIRQAAQINTRSIGSKANLAGKGTSYAEQELALEKAEMAKQNATAGSLAAKANLVKDFNERNNK